MPMKTIAILACGLAFATGKSARADDKSDAIAVLDKAIKAHGGAGELKKLANSLQKMKGTIHIMGMDIPFTADLISSGEDKIRADIDIEAGGMKIHVVSVVNKDKGWEKIKDDTKELDKDKITEGREQAHAASVANLYPLKDKAYTLSLVGDDKVEGKEVTVIRATRKDRRDVSLFFDKKSNLLLKSETRVKDEATGQEVSDERFFSDYNDKGLRQPKKMIIKRDGKPFLEGEITEMKVDEKFDDSSFEKP